MKTKYPRTPHLPWSPGYTPDDIINTSNSSFEGETVVVTEKMDGENTSLYNDGMHARSLDSRHHPSRSVVKAWHASIAHLIPEGWRLCGENLYAKHSIGYEDLKGYFYLFSVWDNKNECLSWDDTEEWAEIIGCPIPKVIYKGIWNENLIKSIKVDEKISEGYVVRLADSFHYDAFKQSVSKWVRSNHVVTDSHWMNQEIISNKIA